MALCLPRPRRTLVTRRCTRVQKLWVGEHVWSKCAGCTHEGVAEESLIHMKTCPLVYSCNRPLLCMPSSSHFYFQVQAHLSSPGQPALRPPPSWAYSSHLKFKSSLLFLCFFKKLYFIDYAITVVPIFPPLPFSTQHPHFLRPSPQHRSCPCVMPVSSLATPFPVLYFPSPWLFWNYRFVVLNPLTPLPSGNHQNTLCIHDSVSVFLFA